MRTEAETGLDPRLSVINELTVGRREALAEHPVYAAVVDGESLRCFMEHHVWAVYDFMVLLGELRARFAPSGASWLPPRHRDAARAVNEITLVEESDEYPSGGYASHFELYVAAMSQVGAPVRPLMRFLERVAWSGDVVDALKTIGASGAVKSFTAVTVAHTRSAPAAAAAFCFGRELLLPSMCQALLRSGVEAPLWSEYLRRHVDVDGNLHGPASMAILTAACGDSDERWTKASAAAVRSLDARIDLWDAALRAMGRG